MSSSPSLNTLQVDRGDRVPKPEDDSDSWALFFAAVDRWRLFVVLPLVFGVAAGLLSFLPRPSYTSVTSFTTDSRDRSQNIGGIAGVASQLGLGIAASPNSSPQFYADVLKSREVIEAVLRSKIKDPRSAASPDSVTVLDLVSHRRWRSPLRPDEAVARLRGSATPTLNPRTGIVELRVTSNYPSAAKQTAQRFLEILNEFNQQRRQTQAGQRRRFANDRLREAGDSLRVAEQAVVEFAQSNQQYRQTSPLAVQYERLQRQVNMYQALYTQLRSEYEVARLDEVNDTPTITIIDAPDLPVNRSAPSRKVAVVVGAMLGGFVALVALLSSIFLDQLRVTRPDEHARLVALGRSARRVASLGLARSPRA